MFRLKALKWYIICQGGCLIWGPKPIISLRNSFVFCWFLKCSMSHISFCSLTTCRSFCESRSHLMYYNELGALKFGNHLTTTGSKIFCGPWSSRGLLTDRYLFLLAKLILLSCMFLCTQQNSYSISHWAALWLHGDCTVMV